MGYPGWLGQMDNSLLVILVSTDDGDKLRRPFYKYLFTKIYKDII